MLICGKNTTNCEIDNNFNTNCKVGKVECLVHEYCFVYWTEELREGKIKRWKYVGCLQPQYGNLCKLNEGFCLGDSTKKDLFFYVEKTLNFVQVFCCCKSNLCNMRVPTDKSVFERIEKDRQRPNDKNSETATIRESSEKELNKTSVIQELKGRKYELRKEQLHLVIGIFYTITLALSTPCLIVVCTEYYRSFPKDIKTNEESELIYGKCLAVNKFESEQSDSSKDDIALPAKGININTPFDEANSNLAAERMENIWKNKNIPNIY
ncbi:unnamed protein product [Dimorphilus gyrociliatus]|uniref:Uncharacterized protein n=1 Tax=Dimorphilus gyrociliatus TaxID=2664684 RepID=A0A7I8V961_9ANNE|nr:unnamed protein product [Dimorphilus gyrociliatus]